MDTQKILGRLIANAISGSSPRRKGSLMGGLLGGKITLGMGMIGLVMAAFNQAKSGGSLDALKDQFGFGGSETPQPAKPIGPPVFGGATTASVSPPTQMQQQMPANNSKLLVQAMVAAAGTDGLIDKNESRRILLEMSEGGLSEQEKAFLQNEISTPKTVEYIVSAFKATGGAAEFAEQLYTVAVATIEVETDSERAFLKELAAGIKLVETKIAEINQLFGVTL